MRPNWVSVALDPFPERKGSRLPGRNPASIVNSIYFQLTEFGYKHGFFAYNEEEVDRNNFRGTLF
jgi:hypothetical protein